MQMPYGLLHKGSLPAFYLFIFIYLNPPIGTTLCFALFAPPFHVSVPWIWRLGWQEPLQWYLAVMPQWDQEEQLLGLFGSRAQISVCRC